MAGTDRYSLLVESQTRGEQQLTKFGAALDAFTAAAERAAKATAARGTADPSRAAAEAARKVEEATRRQQEALRTFASNVRGTIENPLQAAGVAAENFVLKFGSVGIAAGTAALGIGIAGKAMFGLVSSAGGAAEQMQNLADRTGLSLAQVDRFQAMAAIAGVNVEALATGGRTLAKVLQDTGQEGSDARKAMADFGLSLYDSRGGVKDLGDVLEQVLSKLSSTKDESKLLAEATKLLGKGGTELLPLIRNFQELDRTAKELGFGSRNQLLADLAKADDAIDKLGLRWDILKTKLAEPASAVVTIITKIADFAAPVLNFNAGRFGEDSARALQRAIVGGSQLPDPAIRPTIRIPGPDVTIRNSQDAAREAAQRQLLASQFTGRLSRTEDGQQNRLREIERRRSELLGPLQSGALDGDAFRTLNTEFNKLSGEQKAIEAAIKASNALPALRERINEFVLRSVEVAADSTVKALDQITRNTVELLSGAPSDDQPRILAASARLTSAELSRASAARFERISGGRQTALELEAEASARRLSEGQLQQAGGVFLAVGPNAPVESRGLIDAGKARAAGLFERENRERERTLALIQQSTDFDQRRIELLAGPGGELNALERITGLRLQQIDLARQLGAQIDVQAEKTKVLQDAELRRLEIVKQQRDAFKESIGRGFDSLIGGGASGLKAFALSQVTGQLRTVATNLGGELFSSTQGRFTLPGQRNADGSKNFLGRLLSGTLAADNTGGLKTATDLNTQATQENTLALQSARLGGGGTTGGGGTLSQLSAAFGLPSRVFSGTGSNPFIFSAVPSLPPGLAPKDSPIVTGQIPFGGSTNSTGFLNQYGSKAVTTGVYAAALAGGAAGVASGIKTGGVRGGLTAVASGLGAAAAIDPEPVSKAVLAIAAVAAGLASQYLPDPKKAREKEIDRFGEESRYQDPGNSLFETDFAGRAFDTNIRGETRPTVNLTVQALDARSILDRAEDISDAVMFGIDNGHRLGRSIQASTLYQ